MASPNVRELAPPPDASPFPAGTTAYAYADGASRGNPGPAAWGVVYTLEDGTPLCAEGRAIGRETNNVAEWHGCVKAIERLAGWGVEDAVLRLDSELVVKQFKGEYKVKKEHLRPLREKAVQLSARIAGFRIEHVPRKDNAWADARANLALDEA